MMNRFSIALLLISISGLLLSHSAGQESDPVVSDFDAHLDSDRKGHSAFTFDRSGYEGSAADRAALPIGVFDSGIGGLTVLEILLTADNFDNETLKPGPDGRPDFEDERFIYLGDQANMPYGNYSKAGKTDYLRELILKDATFLLGNRHRESAHAAPSFEKLPVKAIVIACNTATAYGLEDLRAAIERWDLPVPVIGVVEAGARGLLGKDQKHDEAIGVLATVGTCASEVYPKTIQSTLGRAGHGVAVITQYGSADLAAIIEGEPGMKNGLDEQIEADVRALVETHRDSRKGETPLPIGTVMLGCTHFPLVRPRIESAFAKLKGDSSLTPWISDTRTYIDPANWTARQLFQELAKNRIRARAASRPATDSSSFYLSVPNPASDRAVLSPDGGLDHDYKYGRFPGDLIVEDTVVVPMTRTALTESGRRLVQNNLPETWKLLPSGESEDPDSLPPVSTNRKKPNVLLLMSDDLNTALSGFGHPQCKTPHLDKLAARGVRFENMHCQYPVCGASRASLMTGLYPYTNGMLGNSGNLRENLPDIVTMSQLFRQAGYRVGRVSKIFHMGIPHEIIAGTADHDDPLSWDETVNVQAPEQNAPGTRTEWSPMDKSSQTFTGVEASTGDLEHADGMAAEAAIEFLKRNRDRPFFLGCGFVRPHVPLVAPEKYFELYDRNLMEAPEVPEGDLDDVPEVIRGYKSNDRYGVTPELHKGLLEAYYASVSYMDAQVGRVLDALDDLGLSENTIVVFSSDHGYLLGHHHKFQKQHLFEESTRVPFIFAVPWMKDSQGKATRHLTELVDVYPTVAELAGLTPPETLQGRSVVPLLTDPSAARWERDFVFTISRSGGESIRSHDWRFTHWGFGTQGNELYDLQNDPGEFTNLANDPAHADRLAEMQKLLEAKRNEAGYDPKKYR